MSRILLIIIWSILMQHRMEAQSKWVFENYNYLSVPGMGAVVPVVHFETSRHFYAELRYNYEETGTVSMLVGKTFHGGEKLSYSIIPMTGYSVGKFTGISLAVHTEIEWKAFYFSSQSQQSNATRKGSDSFFFNWSELGFSIGDHFFAGGAMQYTRQRAHTEFEPGIVAGLSFRNFSIPCYFFNPLRPDAHIVLGVNFEWSFKRKIRS